jgi:accessory colonization factor AcfC
MHDQDHRFGRGYRKGMTAIGVVAHGGYGGLPGHGTGVVTIMSGPSEQIETVPAERANVRDYLNLPD